MPSVRDIPLETGYPDILTRSISAWCACRRNQPKQSTLLSQGLPCCNFHLYRNILQFGECAVLAGKAVSQLFPDPPWQHNCLCLNTKPT